MTGSVKGTDTDEKQGQGLLKYCSFVIHSMSTDRKRASVISCKIHVERDRHRNRTRTWAYLNMSPERKKDRNISGKKDRNG